jgi:7,8-dihydro-6-hydroxymethylpterin-pyrophosphokinase
VIDNIGNKLDSDPDAIEFALWSAVKHLRQATDEIEDVGEKNLSDLLSRVDSDPLGDDEGAYLNRMMKMNKPTTTSSLKSELEKTESSPI